MTLATEGPIAFLSLEELIAEAFHGHGTQATLETMAQFYKEQSELYPEIELYKQVASGLYKLASEVCS